MAAFDFDEDSVVEDDDMPKCPGGGHVDYFIELFATQEQLWCHRSPLCNKIKHRRGAVYAEMAVPVFNLASILIGS